jgi:hypothetical protein
MQGAHAAALLACAAVMQRWGSLYSLVGCTGGCVMLTGWLGPQVV